MLYLNRADAKKWTRAQRHQWQVNAELQNAAEKDLAKLLSNAGISPDEAYREMEDRTMIVADPAGEFATWAKLNAVSRSVNLGKLEYTYRQASEQTGGKVSLSGQTGIITDAVEYKNASTVVPIIDHGVKRDWREYLTFGADGFDTMVDDAREGTKVIMRTANDYLWNGDATVVGPDGAVWTGLRNSTSLVQTTTAVDMADAATGGKAIVDEVSRLRDILRITNNCSGMIEIGISREMMSYWERTPYNQNDVGYGTVLTMVRSLSGIAAVYEDPALTGGQQMLMAKIDLDGLHAVTGQAMSDYMVQRTMHNDPYTMVKWMAQGYIAKSDYKGQKTAMYVQAA
ncbi:virion structural protein [Vibrio phage pYD21-A]|uniref:virion structural protein n=1 Tax=Vibrio phage pYD21-A TaxID=754049 RepID=UPI0002C0DC35|nr:virion structural protein [Vibrio phage pYD21-A]AGH16062.1 hypothetical protein VPKG_00025 [Vibrio phage pYD21-A]